MEFDTDVLDMDDGETETGVDSDADCELPLAHRAAASGDIGLLVQAVQRDPGALEQRDGEGYTPLAHAVQAHQLHAVKRLVKMGADVNAQDTDGRTYLAVAAYQGWHEGVIYLLRNGAKQTLRDKSGRTPLHASTYDNDTRTLTSLLQRLSLEEINETDNEKMTALHWASFHDRPEHARQLLLRGAWPKIQDMDGKTPLHWAAQNGSMGCTIVLANYEPDAKLVRVQDNSGKTAVHLAAAAGHADVLEALFDFDSSVFELEDQDDRAPLHWAAAMGHPDCVRALLQLGVAPNPLDVEDGSPLEYARQANHTACCRLLEERLGLRESKARRSVQRSTQSPNTDKSSGSTIGFIKGLFRKNKRTKPENVQKSAGNSNELSAVIRGVQALPTFSKDTAVHPAVEDPSKERQNRASRKKSRSQREKVTSLQEDRVPPLPQQHSTPHAQQSDTTPRKGLPQTQQSGSAVQKDVPRLVLSDETGAEEQTGHRKKHRHKRKKRHSIEDHDNDETSRPSTWRTVKSQESLPEVQGRGMNSLEPIVLGSKSTHLSPLGNTRASSVSPIISHDLEPLQMKRQGELAPLTTGALQNGYQDSPVSPKMRHLKKEHDGHSRSPTPPPYLTVSVNAKKSLPGISPLTVTDPASQEHVKKKRKKKKHRSHDSLDNPQSDIAPTESSSSINDRVMLKNVAPIKAIDHNTNSVGHSEPLVQLPVSSTARLSPGLTGLRRTPSPNTLLRYPSDDAISLYKLSGHKKQKQTMFSSPTDSPHFQTQGALQKDEIYRIS